MSIVRETLSTNETLIRIIGRFDFNTRADFQSCYSSLTKAGGLLAIDFGETDYIDSSALGMLLLLKEHTDSLKKHVVIRNCNPEVEQILTVSKFDTLFTIES